jgi:hypothetical protein
MNAVKQCAKCGAQIPADEVAFAASEPERCHDCSDYCDDPECTKCADNRADHAK